MSPEQIKDVLEREPFEPFTVHLEDGREVRVLARDLVLVYPGGRKMLVVAPKFPGAREDEDFRTHRIDVLSIDKLTTSARRGRGGRRKAS
jgi:hypothetical protein